MTPDQTEAVDRLEELRAIQAILDYAVLCAAELDAEPLSHAITEAKDVASILIEEEVG